MVKEFHEFFGAPVLTEPTIPEKDRCDLRISLIQEELNELKEAIENNDLVEVADALCDLQYVLSGTILEFGFKNLFGELFREVHRSNMSKGCKTTQEAVATIDYYEVINGVKAIAKPIQNKGYIIYRESDNKVLKSTKYKPADLKGILNVNNT